MDTERAQQIFESHGVIEVFYNGAPVWIENVKDASVEATYLGSSDKIEIPVNKLTEGKRLH